MKKLIFILICMLAVVPGEAKTENNSTITKPTSNMGAIMTVLGLIRPSEFGKVLVHEHVMVDFIGAAKTGRHRYNQDDVVETMLPYLHAVRQRGFTGFVDCTPAWLGRDVEVLRRLAEQTDLHILTNTGYYGTGNDKFLPAHAFSETDGQLAARWVREWEHGIDGTN
ncbi:MAG: phosphotriesterase family protein, partial [Planctomycetota bacterium]